MNIRKARRIVENDGDVNMVELAEALLEVADAKAKSKPIPSHKRAVNAWLSKKARDKAEEKRRKDLVNVWNKYKKV